MLKIYVSRKGIFEWMLCIMILLYMQPFFTWNTYKYGSFFQILSIALLIISIILLMKEEIGQLITNISALLLIILLLYVYFVGEESQIGSWGVLLQYIFIFLLFLSSSELKLNVFEKYRKLFAILLIPGIISFLLLIIGINLPHNVISDYVSGRNLVYIHYPFSVLRAGIYSIGSPSMRFCGFLNEPGDIGTNCALLFCIRKCKVKDWSDFTILIAGLLSLSTAFFLIIFLYIIAKYLLSNKDKISVKKFFTFIMVCTALIIILIYKRDFVSSIYNEVVLKKIKTGDFRDSASALTTIKTNFFNHFDKFLFGQGYYSFSKHGLTGYSIVNLMFDIGIIGILILVTFILSIKPKNIEDNFQYIRLFKIIFILSMIQRPYIVTIPYMFILFSGIEYISFFGPNTTGERDYENSSSNTSASRISRNS